MTEDSRSEIMEATYEALCKHGYADVSIQKIADESDRGKSLIYYHFEDKEDLMLSFLDAIKEDIEAFYKSTEKDSAEKRLEKFLDFTMGLEDEGQWDFLKSYMELRAHATHSESFAEKFREIDEMALEYTTDIVEEMGSDRPGVHAELLLHMIEGAATKKVSTGDRQGLKDTREHVIKAVNRFIKEAC